MPGLPPSDNHAYENVPLVRRGAKVIGGGRRLSEAGRTFKVEFCNHIARHYPGELQMFKKNTRYIVWCIFYFNEVENKGYPKKTDTRYKILDGVNRTKLLFDTIAELTGCDDSTYFDVVISKRQGAERIDVAMWNAEEEETFFVFGKEA